MRKVFFLLGMVMAPFLFTGQIIDEAASKVTFQVRNMKMRTVEGTIQGMHGELEFKADNPASAKFNVCIDVSTLNTESKKRDHHLMNKDFFEVEKYPEICFVSRSIIKSDLGYVATGMLTIKDVSQEVQIPFKFENGHLIGELQISRLAYHVGADTGTFMVGEEIDLTIDCKVR